MPPNDNFGLLKQGFEQNWVTCQTVGGEITMFVCELLRGPTVDTVSIQGYKRPDQPVEIFHVLPPGHLTFSKRPRFPGLDPDIKSVVVNIAADTLPLEGHEIFSDSEGEDSLGVVRHIYEPVTAPGHCCMLVTSQGEHPIQAGVTLYYYPT